MLRITNSLRPTLLASQGTIARSYGAATPLAQPADRAAAYRARRALAMRCFVEADLNALAVVEREFKVMSKLEAMSKRAADALAMREMAMRGVASADQMMAQGSPGTEAELTPKAVEAAGRVRVRGRVLGRVLAESAAEETIPEWVSRGAYSPWAGSSQQLRRA